VFLLRWARSFLGTHLGTKFENSAAEPCRYDLGVIGGVVASKSFESTFKNPGANEVYVYIVSNLRWGLIFCSAALWSLFLPAAPSLVLLLPDLLVIGLVAE
jgi:hypothetical protein